MIDRKIQPQAKAINKVDFVKPDLRKLDNGIPFYSLKAGSQPVLRLEFFFKAGTKFQTKPLQASYTISQLTEGTKSHTARQIADHLDYFGAFVNCESEDEQSVFTLHCLAKNFKDVWPVIKEVLLFPVFSEQELHTAKTNGKQKLSVNLNKVEFVARREFSAALFGIDHPYGKKTEAADYDMLNREDLAKHYQQFYTAKNCTILASGNFGDDVFESLNKDFNPGNNDHETKSDLRVNPQSPTKINVPKAGSVQCGVRLGKVMFNRTHPDYIGMNVVNTLLGGYFGSRLMSNIREDKGYTYGIGSAIANLPDTGVFLVATEVGGEVCKAALKEIYFEVERLRLEEVSAEELSLVKNYLLGSFLRNSDGPFAMADRFKSIHFYHQDYSYYDHYIAKVNSITPKEIKDLAVKYLDPATFTEIVVGEMK